MTEIKPYKFDTYTAFISVYYDGIRKLGDALNRGVSDKYLTDEEQKEIKKQLDNVEKTYLRIRREKEGWA